MKQIFYFSFFLLIIGCRTDIHFDYHSPLGEVNLTTNVDSIQVDSGDVKFGDLTVFSFPQLGTKQFNPVTGITDSIGGPIVLYPWNKYTSFVYNDIYGKVSYRDMTDDSLAQMYLVPYEGKYVPVPDSVIGNYKFSKQPHLVFLTQLEEFELTEEEPKVDVHASLKLVVIKIKINVPVKDVVNVFKARGSLSGVSEAIFLSTSKISTNTSNVIFDFDTATDGVTATIRVFGLPLDPTAPNKLNIVFVRSDGSKIYFDYDITDKLTQDDIRDIGGEITLDESDAPIIGEAEIDSGFKPSIPGWETDTIILN